MSSLFPLLRSLLFSPLESQQEQRGASIQHIIQDRDRGGFTTPDRQQGHLSFHDTGLRGSQGALIVLEALATNPFASKLTLSHNLLGDLGIHTLATRIRFLKTRRTTTIQELNLASNALTDTALTDLCRSWEGLAELYLSNNRITLASTPSPFLGLGNLTLLSLTSNPIDCSSLSALLRDTNLAPLQLTTLHLSACSLDLSVAISLALWLEDRARSGNLEWLAVNGNHWGTPGCERIVWALARRGGNSNLLRVEMLACDLALPLVFQETSQDARGHPSGLLGDHTDQADHARLMYFKDVNDLEDCRLAIELEGGWKKLLEKCEARNLALRLATRRAALGLVSTARYILLSTPLLPTSSEQGNKSKEMFPWERLPEELKLNIWRWVSILCAFPGLHQPSRPGSRATDDKNHVDKGAGGSPGGEATEEEAGRPYDLPDPLTPSQLLNVINYAQDRASLHVEIGRRDEALFNHLLAANALRHTPPSVHRQLVDNLRRDTEIDRQGKLSLLSQCDCLRFQGDI